jgi:hypothetical protein
MPYVLTQDQVNHRVREALKFTGFEAQMGAMRVIVRNTPPDLLVNCPWYVEWLVENRERIREMVTLTTVGKNERG